jgi:hypothetical protein
MPEFPVQHLLPTIFCPNGAVDIQSLCVDLQILCAGIKGLLLQTLCGFEQIYGTIHRLSHCF